MSCCEAELFRLFDLLLVDERRRLTDDLGAEAECRRDQLRRTRAGRAGPCGCLLRSWLGLTPRGLPACRRLPRCGLTRSRLAAGRLAPCRRLPCGLAGRLAPSRGLASRRLAPCGLAPCCRLPRRRLAPCCRLPCRGLAAGCRLACCWLTPCCRLACRRLTRRRLPASGRTSTPARPSPRWCHVPPPCRGVERSEATLESMRAASAVIQRNCCASSYDSVLTTMPLPCNSHANCAM